MAIESWLSVKGLLAARHGALEPLRLAVNGLDVHQEIVAHTETPSTLLALWGCGGEGGREGRREGGREREKECVCV